MTATFSADTTGFTIGDLTLVNATASAFAGSGAVYTFTLVPSAQGAFSVSVPANAAISTVLLAPSNASNILAKTFDSVPPLPVLSGPALTASTSVPVTVTFSEPVTGFALADVVVANGTASALTGSGAIYTVTITIAGPAAVTVDIPAGAANDLAGNPSAAALQLGFTVTASGPTVTIDQAGTQVDPTATASVTFSVVFSVPVSGFTAGAVRVSGTAPGTLTVGIAGSGAAYVVTITGMTGSGTVIATIPADVVTAGGLPNSASTSSDNTVTFVAPAGGSTGGGSSSSSRKCGVGSGFSALLMAALLIALSLREREARRKR